MKHRFTTRPGAVVSLSGGLDSTVTLAQAVAKFGSENVYTLGFDYGQRHRVELDQAKKIADYYDVSFQIVQLPRLYNDGSALMDANVDINRVANETYRELAEQHGSQPTVVPNRNMAFISLSITHALVVGVNQVWLGVHANDALNFAYPDCTTGFIGAMASACQISTEGAVTLIAPFNDQMKADIVRRGFQLDAPLHLTQSCYQGKRPACGVCSTCLERIEAFKLNELQDPIEYDVKIDWPDDIPF